jgi:hypothetical protein
MPRESIAVAFVCRKEYSPTEAARFSLRVAFSTVLSFPTPFARSLMGTVSTLYSQLCCGLLAQVQLVNPISSKKASGNLYEARVSYFDSLKALHFTPGFALTLRFESAAARYVDS